MSSTVFSRCVSAGAAAFGLLALAACSGGTQQPVDVGVGANPDLPPPQSSLLPTVNIAPAERWAEGEQPTPADGLAVTEFAAGLDHPRWLYVLPNGDVLVAETNAPETPTRGIMGWIEKKVMARAGAGVPSADRITLLRDANGDGVAEQRHAFATDLHSPFGMALVGNDFYVANTDAVLRFDYSPDALRISGPGEKVADLPAGEINRHWTKNLIAGPQGRYLYVAIGSNSNIAENGLDAETGRAAIWRIERATGELRTYASGLRNPVGMDFVPATGALWVAVNERDELGDNLVPDYMTHVEPNGFYGWPWSYFGQHVDERVEPQNPERVAQALVPDYALGAHTASLGLTFSGDNALTPRFANGMFVGQHGSWNRKPRSGYKVIFVPFNNGAPAGAPRDVLTGFVSGNDKAQGRPVGVVIDQRGGLLVADDVGNRIWRVTAAE